jgi:predicted amidohydrolase/ribosomal protein S18 acetylase RimI-like enzyme
MNEFIRDNTPSSEAIIDRKLELRNATLQDIPQIVRLAARVYPKMAPYTASQIKGLIRTFSEGQFVVAYEAEIVGFAATFITREHLAFEDHTWQSITGGGYGARHAPSGDWLYGMEVCVDSTRRRLRIGKRLYEARKGLCQSKDLKGIAFAGRMPNYKKRRKQFPNPQLYLEAVIQKEIKDPVLSFQIRAGFEPIRAMRNYDPDDRDSGGHAVLMTWRNPSFDTSENANPSFRLDPVSVRVTTVQLQARAVKTRDEFYQTIENFIDSASDYKSDFVVFPELFTLQMLAAEHKKIAPDVAIEILSTFTDEFVEKMRGFAISYNINIIGGSHPTRTEDGDIQNVAYVFKRDGEVHSQEKLHPTPDERYWWNIKGGDRIETIDTDCGPIGVLICYDSEFPELARRLVDQGAQILFVPFCTDTRQGYLRVRYCCQARAVENQCYVVTSGNVGNLPEVENMDLQYAQSAIFTPCDYPFARDGIAAETSENVEMVAVADLNLTTLNWARHEGSVRNLRDRRFDLYRTVWQEPKDVD